MTAGVGVNVTAFADSGFAGADFTETGPSFAGSCPVGTALGASVVAAALSGPSDGADVSPANGCAGVGLAEVDGFLTVVDFAVDFFAVVDFDVVDFTVVDLVGLVFFAAGDLFGPDGFCAAGAAVALGVASTFSTVSGFAMAETPESDAATACFFAAVDAGCFFVPVVAFFGAVDVFFAFDDDFAFCAPDAALDEAEPSMPSAVVRFVAALAGFCATAAEGFFAAEAAGFFDGAFFAGAFLAAGFFAPPDDAAVTAPCAADDGVSDAAVSGACAGWVASSPGGVSSEEEEGAEVTHEIYQLALTTASSARN